MDKGQIPSLLGEVKEVERRFAELIERVRSSSLIECRNLYAVQVSGENAFLRLGRSLELASMREAGQ